MPWEKIEPNEEDGWEYWEYYIGCANTPSVLWYRIKDGVLETSDDINISWSIVEDHTYFNTVVKNPNGWGRKL